MAGGGAAPAPKVDELVPHPVKDQLPNVSYCITSPPPWRQYLLLSPLSLPIILLLHQFSEMSSTLSILSISLALPFLLIFMGFSS